MKTKTRTSYGFPSVLALIFLHSSSYAQSIPSATSITVVGQLLTEDSLQPLSQVEITATSSTRPVTILETTTGADGRFSLSLIPGITYRLCSAAIGNYVDSCRFYLPLEVTASIDMPAISMTAVVGTRMRVRIIDPDGIIHSADGTVTQDPLLLLVFADEDVTQTRIPLQLGPSATVANAAEAASVIPNTMSWHLGMSSTRAQLFDASGNPYQSNTPIPKPNDYGSDEFLAVFTVRAK
jgi:hypothetical protein